jgi:glycosyltransferase involved in cell wall biosynthesis
MEALDKILASASLLILSGTYTPMMAWAAARAAVLDVKSLLIITTNSLEAAQKSFEGSPLARRIATSLYLWSDRFCAGAATRVFTRSEEYARVLRTERGIAVEGVMTQNSQYKSFYRLDALDAEAVAAARAQRELLTGGRPDRPLLLFAGRFRIEKRIPLLVAAFREASKLGLFDGGAAEGCVLAVVGSGDEKTNRALKEELHDPHNGGVVVVPRFFSHEELRSCYHAADVHVSASEFETLGNTVHESLLCGTPVVVQRAGGYISQVEEGKRTAGAAAATTQQGFLVDFEDVEAVARAIEKAVAIKRAEKNAREVDGGSGPFLPIGPRVLPDAATTEGKDIVRSLLFGGFKKNKNKLVGSEAAEAVSGSSLVTCSLMLSTVSSAYLKLAAVEK